MTTFYVQSVPMPLVIGGFSYGTHVATNGDLGSAIEVAKRLGFTPVGAIRCPGFDCTCQRDARRTALGL
jgi:hypothetical protein